MRYNISASFLSEENLKTGSQRDCSLATLWLPILAFQPGLRFFRRPLPAPVLLVEQTGDGLTRASTFPANGPPSIRHSPPGRGTSTAVQVESDLHRLKKRGTVFTSCVNPRLTLVMQRTYHNRMTDKVTPCRTSVFI